ncbi:polymorphic toxin type 15 domain-containing protein [Paenibacillus oralis]|uniref:polymorphic toxin type 15 domain-containing protein n=1 Tax=Paenibacillus oralis TaxID=2490856 RepID=UPI001FE653E3|nr:polymorphic toxin type 15 domain-containing protein [Paenibacillus oralis]
MKGQKTEINQLTVYDYLKNSERYIAEGRAIEGNAAQQAAREEALAQKINELQKQGLTLKEAKEKASAWIKNKAILHNPDQIAGGNPLNVGGLGDSPINSSIGRSGNIELILLMRK